MTKVLYLMRTLDVGGVETNLLRLCPLLRARGVTVHIGSRGGELRSSFIATGAILHDFAFDHLDPFALARDVGHLRAVLRTELPDIVHVFSAAPGVVMTLARASLPLHEQPTQVASVMGLQASADESSWITQTRNYLTILGAKRCYVISPMIGRHLRRLPIRRSRLVDLPVVGVEFSASLSDVQREAHRAGLRDELGLPSHHRVVSTIGQLSPRKNHELIVEAADTVLRTHQDVTFLIVGAGPGEDALRVEIERRGLGDRVLLLGLRRDLERILVGSDVYVKPGIVEGFIGITVLQAQAMEVPVVAFNTVDVHLAIDHEDTGLLVRIGDTAELSRAICRLLDEPQTARDFARRGRQRAAERFSLENVVDGLLAAYRKEIRPTRQRVDHVSPW